MTTQADLEVLQRLLGTARAPVDQVVTWMTN